MNMSEKFAIVTHRGGKGPYPDNTPEAYSHSVTLGSESVEMDIRFNYLSREFFMAHDFIHRPWRRRNNLLKDAVAEIPENVTLVIEFKTVSFFTHIFVKNFIRFHHEHLKNRNILVMSFNPFVLMRLRKFAPDIPRGILCGSLFWKCIHDLFLSRFVLADYYILNKRFLSRRNTVWARDRGMKVYTYLVNTLRGWKKSLKYEVDGIITDYPEKFMFLRESQSPETVEVVSS